MIAVIGEESRLLFAARAKIFFSFLRRDGYEKPFLFLFLLSFFFAISVLSALSADLGS